MVSQTQRNTLEKVEVEVMSSALMAYSEVKGLQAFMNVLVLGSQDFTKPQDRHCKACRRPKEQASSSRRHAVVLICLVMRKLRDLFER